MGTQQHVIKKVIFEVQISSQEEGHETHELFSNLWHSSVCNLVEELLSRYSLAREIISIDKLEIDLGDLEQDTLGNDIPLRVREALEQKLTQVIEAARVSSTPEVYNGSDKTTVPFRSAKTSELELLVHFIRTGTMPWWAKNEDTSLTRLFESLIEHEPAKLRVELMQLLGKSNYRKRIIYQLQDKMIGRILSLYDTSFASFASSVVQYLEELSSAGTIPMLTQAGIRIKSWEHFIGKIINGSTSTAKEEKTELITSLLLELSGGSVITIREMGNKARNAAPGTGDLDGLFAEASNNAIITIDPGNAAGKQNKKNSQKEQEEKEAKKKPGKNKKTKDQEKTSAEDDPANDDGTDEKRNDDNTDHLSAEEKKRSAKENIAEKLKQLFGERNAGSDEIEEALSEGVYIRNAGIVILWPYLNPFFTHLQLVKGNAFTSEEASHRAVHLLQYLATGSETVSEEHELVLNKLLCGIPVEEPVSNDFTITEEERTESLNLLTAVVDNWTALRRTSPQALQSTFFIKEGLLTHRSNWSLKIERQSVDMLIDKLPWAISIISLPWSKEVLYVEW